MVLLQNLDMSVKRFDNRYTVKVNYRELSKICYWIRNNIYQPRINDWYRGMDHWISSAPSPKGSSHRRKSAAWHKFDIVWLYCSIYPKASVLLPTWSDVSFFYHLSFVVDCPEFALTVGCTVSVGGSCMLLVVGARRRLSDDSWLWGVGCRGCWL